MSKYSQLVTLLTSADDTNFELGLRLVLSTVKKNRRGDVLGALLMTLAHSWVNNHGYYVIRKSMRDNFDLTSSLGGFVIVGKGNYPSGSDESIVVCSIKASNTWLDEDADPIKELTFKCFFSVSERNVIEPRSIPSMKITWHNYEENYKHTLYTEDIDILDKWAAILLNGVKLKI